MDWNAFWVFGSIILVTGAYLLAFAFNLSPFLRDHEAWRWAYGIPGKPWRHIIPVAIVAAYSLNVVLWLNHLDVNSTRFVTPFLIVVALSVPLIQVTLLFPESPNVLKPLFYRTISAGARWVFSVGSTIMNPSDFLRRYPSLMPTFPVHPQRYPPG
jgi:hypothetical protein